MAISLRYSLYKNVKNLCFLFYVITQVLLPPSVLACPRAFQEILPGQLKARLLLISENKKEDIENMEVEPCGPNCLSFSSKAGISFQIKIDSSLKEPTIEISPSSKVLTIPSHEWFNRDSSESVLKSWLIGHEAHPYTSPSHTIQLTKPQRTALIAFKQSLKEGAKSFLHIAPTSAGKTLVMAQALKEKLQSHRKSKISFVTADQIKLVDQLFEAIQLELTGMNVSVINWNNKSNKDFYVEMERSFIREHSTVFVITSQSLKSQLEWLQREKERDYVRLVENTDGIYIDEAHHLGAFHTKSALLTLRERSGAFLYGTTATPVHHEVSLRDFFKREHWSYLNTVERGNLFASHPAEKVVEQLSIGIERGEITPFDALYIIGENSFNIIKEQPLFIQPLNHLRVLNTHYYSRLAAILHPILSSNRKGFIVTATISEANRLSEFLNEAIEGVKFESYHSEMTKEQRKEVLRNSEEMEFHYIVAVKALDEGVNLPHLSAYIDLNANVSVKQMVHRIGRVLRLYGGKTNADILFLADYRSEQMAKDLLSLLDVIDRTVFHRGIVYRGGSGDTGLRAPEVEPITREELRKLREELRQTVRSFWNNRNKPTFFATKEEAYELIQRKNVTSTNFPERRKIDPELQRIPPYPYDYYEGWSWFEARGKAKPNFLTKEEAYELIQRKNVTSTNFHERRKTDPELQRIPPKPRTHYEGWSWKEAKGKLTFFEIKEEAYELIQRKNVTSANFHKQRKTDPELQRIPANPRAHYEGWSWKEARGKLTFFETKEEAYELIQKKNVTFTNFHEQRKTDPELQRISSNPYYHYPGWSWKEARGQ
jgi:superfamily II DNA or RNA helicase